MKIRNAKYYTPTDLAERLINKTFKIIGKENITDIIEPSAGKGAFSNILNCKAYDIEPEADNIIKQDFLTLNLFYKKGRLIIGNPPFGERNSIAVKFYQKACTLGDYIAFILPISQLDNSLQMYQFDLIYSEDLGIKSYSGNMLHCCFNIYKRPSMGINKKPDIRLKDISIKDYRVYRDKYYTPKQLIKIYKGYDYAICGRGNGSFGNIPEYIGQYSTEYYFYCQNKDILPEMLKLLERDTIRNYVKSISSMGISMARLYKYFRENIKNIH